MHPDIIVALAKLYRARSTTYNFMTPFCATPSGPAVSSSHPVAGEGVWRQGQPRAAGVIVAGRRASPSGGLRRNRTILEDGLLPPPAWKGTVLRFETEEPGGLAAPARAGLVSIGPKWRKAGAENWQDPACHVMPAPKRSEAAITRSQGGNAENSARSPQSESRGPHHGSGPTRPRSAPPHTCGQRCRRGLQPVRSLTIQTSQSHQRAPPAAAPCSQAASARFKLSGPGA